jgi:hypothetical protein
MNIEFGRPIIEMKANGFREGKNGSTRINYGQYSTIEWHSASEFLNRDIPELERIKIQK